MAYLWFWCLRLLIKPVLSARVPVGFQRAWGHLAALSLRGPKGAVYRAGRIASVPSLTIDPERYNPDTGVLYLHGGAYVMGGFGSHRKLAAAIGDAAGARVWLPDYRLAPEHPHPAALNDALAVYSALLAQGQDPAQLTIAGDSAGAGLALELALAIRDAGLPSPAALVLLSPWADASLSGDSITSHRRRDPMLSAGWLRWAAQAYRGHGSDTDIAGSPLWAELSGLPPLLIQVGSEEILLSDAQRLQQRALAAGADCQLQHHPELWHVFQLQYGWLDEANQAVTAIGDFIRTKASLRCANRAGTANSVNL